MIWLSVKEVAELECISESAVKKRIKNATKEKDYHYIPSSAGQGGKKLEINLMSLSEQAQKAYRNEQGECLTVFNTDYTYTNAQRKKGELRALAVTEHRKYQKEMIKGGMTKKTEIMRAFVTKWNVEHSDFQITCKSLYDWIKKSKSGRVEYLADRRGGYNRGQTTIPQKYIDLFRALYLQESKPTIEYCFRQVQIQANLDGVVIPGIKAFRLLVKNMNPATLIKYREGKKALDDKCMPYTERDYSKLAPNDWWVSDHHLWDIFVRVPDGKGGWKLARPWGSYWMDMRTRKIMSSIIRIESPNADIVLCSFGLGVEHFGVPKGVRLDNGKDYKARDLFFEDKYICSKEDEDKIFNSLAMNLQVDYTFAIPYNAKAKPIERTFRTFEDQLGKQFPAYAGCNAKERPENLKDLNIMDVITLEEFIELHNKYVYEVYNYASHSGNAMYSKSPNYWYSELPFTIRMVSKDVLFFSLMRVKGVRTVGRNGITFNNTHFHNDNCIDHLGKKVIAKYDPTKPEILYIFDKDENYLFIAEEVKAPGWNLTKEDYEQENHRKKIARQKALNNYTADNVIRSKESIGERLQHQADSMEQVPIAKPKTIEIIHNNTIEENVKRINQSDVERNYEEVLKKQSERKQKTNNRQKELADRFKQNMLNRAKLTADQA